MAQGQPLPARSQIVQQHLADAGLTVRELPDSTRTAGKPPDLIWLGKRYAATTERRGQRETGDMHAARQRTGWRA